MLATGTVVREITRCRSGMPKDVSHTSTVTSPEAALREKYSPTCDSQPSWEFRNVCATCWPLRVVVVVTRSQYGS